MNLDAAEHLARSLMNQHGLKKWALMWAWWYDKAGRCLRPMKWILLSVPFLEANDEAEVKEIVLHEIAHALTEGVGDQAHDEEWRRVFVAVGGSGVVQPRLRIPTPPTEGHGRVGEAGGRPARKKVEVDG